MTTVLLWLTVMFGSPPTAYPRADLLVDPQALLPAPPEAVLLDSRPAGAYQSGHMPGALSVSASAWSRKFLESRDPQVWSRLLGELGLSPEREVIVYGSNWTESARIWWILRYWGFEKARILNGTYAAWVAAGGQPVTNAPKPTPSAPQLRPTDRLAEKNDLRGRLDKPSVQILDVRTEREYRGETGGTAKTGCIPGARHLDWAEFIDPKTQKIKPPEVIAERLRQVGIDQTKPTVTYCHVGARSSVAAFVLELMGCESVQNYLRGWSEWGEAEDTPVAKPVK